MAKAKTKAAKEKTPMARPRPKARKPIKPTPKIKQVKPAQAAPVKASQPKHVAVEPPPRKVAKLKLSAKERKHFEALLLSLRDRLLDGINFLATNNLRNSQRESSGDISSYGTHMADAGTDNFDREFALNLVSNEQEALYEVTEAMKRLEAGTYGVCEVCEKPIKFARLNVVPFTRFCVECQAASEKQNRRPSRAVETFAQFEDAEEAEAESEEEKEQT